MHTILRVGKSISFFLFLLLASLMVGYEFPAILSNVHVATVALVLYILREERGRIVWYIFLYSFCLEILFPGHMYGAILIAGTLSAVIAYWSHKFVLTNQSLYTGLLLGFLALASYRGVWFWYHALLSIMSGGTSLMPHVYVSVIVEEFVLTLAAILILFSLVVRKKHRT